MKNKELKVAALKYDSSSPAPFLVAKGKNQIAEKIIEEAKKSNVPIVENIDECEIITLMEIGECIPESTFEAIAKIFAFIKDFE